MSFFKLFWASFVSIGGLVGFYLALVPFKLEWVFWLVLAGAIIVTAAILYTGSGVEFIQRIKKYPRVIERVGELESDLKEAEGRETTLQEEIGKARQEGILEGRQQVIGSFLSSRSRIPTIVAIAPYAGQVSFICAKDQNLPPAGARFVVQSAASQAIRGVVEVTYADDGVALLRCVEPSSPAFWEHLADRIELDDSLPPGIELAAYSYDSSEANSKDVWKAVEAKSDVEA